MMKLPTADISIVVEIGYRLVWAKLFAVDYEVTFFVVRIGAQKCCQNLHSLIQRFKLELPKDNLRLVTNVLFRIRSLLWLK